ncbi:reverse transcriptase domain-containing protein [Micromonospora sp. NPDC005324]|uniref:reverse transcriptase domain-containing protein n=1 Tax=Micromonospora sp. NPDC005324 TaxID=3157033 RepID=UPI0033A12003
MRPMPSEVLFRLKLEQATRLEAGAEEYLMPSSPGAAELADSAPKFAAWLSGQLQAGLVACRGLVVAVAKPATGSRPVAVWGFAERVTYRALTDLLMTEAKHEMDRSSEGYQAFAYAPLTYGRTRGTRAGATGSSDLRWPENAVVQYVVKADIASFYDYIDHDILGRELLLRAQEHAAIECLLELLLEVQGRRYGLPQLLEPSDRLSDLYAGRVLRALHRRQWAAWRYNDDFRIAAETFEDAKRALDDLAAAARDNGLVLNESKTRTPSFATYWEENEVPDYVDDAENTDPQWALDTLSSTVTPRDLAAGKASAAVINLHEADRAAIRTIRRALIRLSDSEEPRGIAVMPKMEHIVAFVPSATPYVLRYLRAMVELDRTAVTRTVAAIATDISLSDWQRFCLIRAIRELRLVDADPFLAWVMTHRAQRFEPAVRAEAALALAEANEIEAQGVIRSLDEEPSALATWYLMALRRLFQHGAVPRETHDAVRDENGLHAAMLIQA